MGNGNYGTGRQQESRADEKAKEILDLVLSRLSGKERRGAGYMAICPAHKDAAPSLSVKVENGKVLLHCFAGCDFFSIAAALGLESKELFGMEPQNQSSKKDNYRASKEIDTTGPPPTISRLSDKFKLEEKFLEKECRLFDSLEGYVGVPFFDEDDSRIHVKRRVAMSGKRKYVYPSGAKLAPYGLWRLEISVRASKSLVLVEGESDCWTLWREGIPAVGIPGATATSCITQRVILGVKTIWIVQEVGEGGEMFASGCSKKLVELGFKGSLRVVRMSKYKDVSEWRISNQEGFGEEFRKELKSAKVVGHFNIADMTRKASEHADQTTDFLWYPYIPIGSPTIVAGQPGVGKSYLSTAIAAHVSSGQRFPLSNLSFEPKDVLIFSGEDDISSTIKPRLIACGADLNRVNIFDLERYDFSLDSAESMSRFGAMIDTLNPGLVVIDPLIAFLGKNIDANRSTDVRSIMRPLYDIARDRNIAILIVAHAKKGAQGGIESVVGSIDFVAAVRSMISVFNDPECEQKEGRTQSVFAHTKSNLASKGKAIRYEIERVGTHTSSIFKWNGASNLSADALAIAAESMSGHHWEMMEAMKFIRTELRMAPNNAMTANEMTAKYRKIGITAQTFQAARMAMGAELVRVGTEWCYRYSQDSTNEEIPKNENSFQFNNGDPIPGEDAPY